MLNTFLAWAKYVLIFALVVGTIIFAGETFITTLSLDWSESDTFFYFLRRIFALLIGIDLVRFMLSFENDTLLEILIFLLARQVILMEIEGDYTHLLGVTIGIAILIIVRVVLPQMKVPAVKEVTTETNS